MSIRTKVLGLVDIMMRVPPLLVIDEILKIGMGLSTRFYPSSLEEGADMTDPNIGVVTADAGGGGGGGGDVLSGSTPLEALLEGNAAATAANLVNTAVTNATSAANTILEAAIDNASSYAATGGVLSSSFGNLMDELAQETSLSDILSITSVKFVICLIGEFDNGLDN